MSAITCPRCGRMLGPPDGAMSVWRRPGCDLLRVSCPACGAKLGKTCVADEEVALLRRLEVPLFNVPAEALEKHSGPPLSPDDLIDLHFLLESERVWELLDSSPPPPPAAPTRGVFPPEGSEQR